MVLYFVIVVCLGGFLLLNLSVERQFSLER